MDPFLRLKLFFCRAHHGCQEEPPQPCQAEQSPLPEGKLLAGYLWTPVVVVGFVDNVCFGLCFQQQNVKC